jgi:hypothetical protein
MGVWAFRHASSHVVDGQLVVVSWTVVDAAVVDWVGEGVFGTSRDAEPSSRIPVGAIWALRDARMRKWLSKSSLTCGDALF